jgi:hypothetical protein
MRVCALLALKEIATGGKKGDRTVAKEKCVINKLCGKEDFRNRTTGVRKTIFKFYP